MQQANDELRMLADSVAQFARSDDTLKRTRRLHQDGQSFSLDTWRQFAGNGWLGILVPEDRGGLDLGLPALAVVAEELGRARVPEPLVAVAGLAASTLSACTGGPARELLAALVSGETLVAVAWQENPEDATPAVKACRAESSGEGALLSGRKYLVTPAEADIFLISARADSGSVLYAVSAGAEGLEIERRQQVDGSWVVDLNLDGVRVGAGDRVAGSGEAEQALALGLANAAILAAAEMRGLADALFQLTTDYLATRQQFGQPLSAFQALRHRAVDLYIQRELMSAALGHCYRALESDPSLQTRQRLAARANARASDAAMRIAREAVQLHGAIGYTEEADVGIYLKRILVLSAWLGNAAWQRQQFAALNRNPEHEEAA